MGMLLRNLDRLAEAEPYYREALLLAIERLITLYDAWGRPALADEWRAKLAAFGEHD